MFNYFSDICQHYNPKIITLYLSNIIKQYVRFSTGKQIKKERIFFQLEKSIYRNKKVKKKTKEKIKQQTNRQIDIFMKAPFEPYGWQ